jgi:N-acetylglucosaminyldiphosphoundecaprenol N-acetyl-beta-D-mannosaminyltransferase
MPSDAVHIAPREEIMPSDTISYTRQTSRVFLLGAWVDPIDQPQAIERILSWCAGRQRQYVVTPNLDHCRIVSQDQALADAYDKAGLVLADGWPLVAASYFTRFPLRRRVTGSDIILPLCRACAEKGYSVFLLGTTNQVLAVTSAALMKMVPGLTIAGMYSPPLGFERDAKELERINAAIKATSPHIVFAALGFPKQERWMASQVPSLSIGAALGIGAGLDFIGGKQRRAPGALRWLGLEWAWRAATDPQRLLKRYLLCIVAFPELFWKHLVRHLVRKEGVRPLTPVK